MTNPELLILDEPTIGLDVEGTILLREYIQKIKNEGTTVFMSSHNLSELQKSCDKFGFIKTGQIVEEGSFSELKEKYFNNQKNDIFDMELIYKKIFGVSYV